MQSIKEKIEIKGLIISRIPSWARDYIKTRAKDEFCDDYGMLISSLIKDAEEYYAFKERLLSGELKVEIKPNESDNSSNKKILPRSINGQLIKSFGGKSENR